MRSYKRTMPPLALLSETDVAIVGAAFVIVGAYGVGYLHGMPTGRRFPLWGTIAITLGVIGALLLLSLTPNCASGDC